MHFNRNIELKDPFHLLFDKGLEFFDLLLGSLKKELVVDLEDQLAFQRGGMLSHPNHCQLDEVRSRSLQGGVDGQTLRGGSDGGVFVVDFGDGASSAGE